MSLIPSTTTLPTSPLAILLPPGDFQVYAANPVASIVLGYREGLPLVQQETPVPIPFQADEPNPGGMFAFGTLCLLIAHLLIKGRSQTV